MRYMDADAAPYRAAITFHYGEGKTRTFYYGPYAGKAQASALVTRELKRNKEYRRSYTVTGRVETLSGTWEEVK